MPETPKPLLSYLLFTYNQEKYIREAVESAFAQTYSPLEIIISDDHSTDNTWEIIKELFNKYNGPHKVIINRNKQNLGIAQHVNKVMSMAKGELFIMAAGDDISLPQRVQVLFDYWYPKRNTIFALTSSNITINSDGSKALQNIYTNKSDFLEIDLNSNLSFNGGGAAYSKSLYKQYGPINSGSYEDLIYFRRALLTGCVQFIKQPLIKYRLGGITTSQSYKNNYLSLLENAKYWSIIRFNTLQQQNKDLLKKNKTNIIYENEIKIMLYLTKLKYVFFKTEQKCKKVLVLLKIIKTHINFYHKEKLKININEFLKMLLSILPIQVSTKIYYFIQAIRRNICS